MTTEWLSERRGHCLVLTLRDPATRNSLSPQANAAAVEVLGTAEGDPELACVILRGDGEHFSAGGNLQRLQATRLVGPQPQRESLERLHTLIETLRAFPKPVLAAVEGYAAGAGCALALACDLVVAAEDAQFVLSYGRVGLSPDGGSSWHLARSLTRAQALRWLWLAEPMGAREAHALGLVTELCDHAQALPRALALGDRLAAMAPNALASAKELLNEAPGRTLREQMDAERDHFVRNLFDPNGGEGIRAFFDKRAPDFRR